MGGPTEAWLRRVRSSGSRHGGQNPGVGLSDTFLSFGSDRYLVRDLAEGVFVVGGNGSGKSSTTIRMMRRRALSLGFGGMELTSKTTDGTDSVRDVRQTRRSADLIHVRPGGPHCCNIIGDAIRRQQESPEDASDEVADTIRAAMDGVDEGKASTSDPIWGTKSDQHVKSTVDFWFCGRPEGEELTAEWLAEIAASAPTSHQAIQHLKERTTARALGKPVLPPRDRFEEFWDRAADRSRAGIRVLNPFTYRSVMRYWTHEYVAIPEKTRESVLFTLRAALSDLTRGEVAAVCCAERSTFSPADARSGKWILVDFPVQKHGRSGRVIQTVLKRQFQRAMEQRSFRSDELGGFVMLLVDEAQNFLSPNVDALWQSTARSSNVCTVMATQSIAAGRQRLGHEGAEQLLGVLQTKWAHACDGETANYMADLIAKDWTYRASFDGEGHVSFSESLEHQVEPVEFSKLARGGPEFGYQAEAIIFKPGARWGPQRRNFLKVRLSQQ